MVAGLPNIELVEAAVVVVALILNPPKNEPANAAELAGGVFRAGADVNGGVTKVGVVELTVLIGVLGDP